MPRGAPTARPRPILALDGRCRPRYLSVGLLEGDAALPNRRHLLSQTNSAVGPCASQFTTDQVRRPPFAADWHSFSGAGSHHLSGGSSASDLESTAPFKLFAGGTCEESRTGQASAGGLVIDCSKQSRVKCQIGPNGAASVDNNGNENGGFPRTDFAGCQNVGDGACFGKLESFAALISHDIAQRFCRISDGLVGARTSANATGDIRKTNPPNFARTIENSNVVSHNGPDRQRRLSRNTACSPNKFQNHHGAWSRSGRPHALRASARSILTPTVMHRSRKSLMVQKWMLGVSYQVCGRLSVCGMRPPNVSKRRMRQWPKLGNDTTAWRPIRSMCSSTARGWRVACRVCDSTT